MNYSFMLSGLFEAALYSITGIVILIITALLINLISPLSFRKEVEDEQNVSYGLIAGAVLIALALIIGSVFSATKSLYLPDAEAPATAEEMKEN